jgi:hypothetical protein
MSDKDDRARGLERAELISGHYESRYGVNTYGLCIAPMITQLQD